VKNWCRKKYFEQTGIGVYFAKLTDGTSTSLREFSLLKSSWSLPEVTGPLRFSAIGLGELN
jgi:hypothetical protein